MLIFEWNKNIITLLQYYVFERRVRRGQVCYSQVVSGVGWGEAEGWTGYIDTSPGAQQWGLMLGYLVLFQR